MAADDNKPLAPPGLSRTFYKRDLPCPPAVAFSSNEGQDIFRDALVSGMLQGFFKLIEQFRTQDEPAYCGLASVAMVLNTLAIDPRRAWKGPWRFFHEQMLDCCLPLEKVRQEGITLQEASCLARCNGAAVDIFHYGSIPVEEFREMVKHACSSGESHLVVSYSRKAFLQTGDGHFSPIGGYSPSQDLVLVLDTARFKYPPHWVKLSELYEAMAAHDPTTGKPRGFLRMKPQPLLESVLFTLDLRDPQWESAFKFCKIGMQKAIEAAAAVDGATAETVLTAATTAAPFDAVSKFIAVRMTGNCSDNGVCTQMSAVETFLLELRGTALYRLLEQHASTPILQQLNNKDSLEDHLENTLSPINENNISNNGDNGENEDRSLINNQGLKQQQQPAVPGPLIPERLAMLLFLAPSSTWQSIPSPTLRTEIENLLDLSSHKVVAHEVQYLKEQYKELPAMKEALEASGPACAVAGCASVGHHCL